MTVSYIGQMSRHPRAHNHVIGNSHTTAGYKTAAGSNSCKTGNDSSSFLELLKGCNNPSSDNSGSVRNTPRTAGDGSGSERDSGTASTAGTIPSYYNNSSYSQMFKDRAAFVASFSGSGQSENKVSADAWRSQKPSFYTDEMFQEKLNEANYRNTLLDEDVLPFGLTSVDEEPSNPRSVVRTEFSEASGGVNRVDYLLGGTRHLTFIPSYEWRKTSGVDTGSGSGSSGVGDVYNQQTPWGFTTIYVRGEGPAPDGYQAGRYEDSIEDMLG